MKKCIVFAFAVTLTVLLIYSCAKQAKEPMSEQQAIQALVSDGQFIDFSKHFITDFAELMQYHRSQALVTNKKDFLLQVQDAGGNETRLATAYHSYSLSYEHAMELKNRLDNDLLQLLNQHKFLQAFSEAQIQVILLNSIDAGLRSETVPWQEAKAEINAQLKVLTLLSPQTKALDGVRMNIMAPDLSLDEIWDCLKVAVGAGTAGVLSIAGLVKLAQDGLQAAVVGVSKWIAARAGWFGLAIMLIDFSCCVYKEARD